MRRIDNVPFADIPALIFPALLDTLIMVGIVMTIVVAVGIPLGALVHNLAPHGLFPRPRLHAVLSGIVSVGRSLPFLILMAAIVPFTRFITGTNIGIAHRDGERVREALEDLGLDARPEEPVRASVPSRAVSSEPVSSEAVSS